MKKVNSTIPVYDICSISGSAQLPDTFIAARFADYLKIHPLLCKAHGHSFYHLLLFTKGAGSHTIDFEHYPVLPGQIYFMSPGQVHSWDFKGEVDGWVVNFSGGFFSTLLADVHYLEQFPFLNAAHGSNVLLLSAEAAQEAAGLFEKLLAEADSNATFSTDMVQMHLLSLFILTSRNSGAVEEHTLAAKPGMVTLQHFRRLLNLHYRQYKLPKDYAALLYITPNHLNALCNELLGKAAGEVIRERVLLEAKRLLVNAGSNISGIGYELGFADNSYFTKFFKKHTGTTPEVFRRTLLQHPH